MKKELAKAYEPKDFEDKIYKKWEKSGCFNPDNLDSNGEAEYFSVSMPPPNVTGILHLGHALENSIMDIEVRYQRMRGRKTLLLPGTDHAAVATQAKVERVLMEKGIKNPREELGREKLLAEIKDYAEKSKNTIISQIKKLGTSCDWSRLAYTFDEERNRAVNEVFVRMYNDGLIYKGYRTINWSVKGQSTCSDDELVYVDRKTKLYTFRYSKDFPIAISTTRPETKLGDTAVAVNPKDKRYKKYIGKKYKVEIGASSPLEIIIIADEAVDMNFGTGAIGVTPAHSMVDFELYEKHKLNIIPVISKDGRMNEQAGDDYAGLTAETAREKFVDYLRKNNLIEKEEEIEHNVATSDRFGDIIEIIPMEQWFVDVNKKIPKREKSLKELMREAVSIGHNGDRAQKIKIVPDRFNNQYFHWIDNLRDWCISRQIWWGHRIPVWYKSHNDTKFNLNFRNKEIFDLIKSGKKTVETRALNPEESERYFGDIKAGDFLRLKYLENNKAIEEINVKVKRAEIYKNTEAMLKKEKIENIYPCQTKKDLIKFQKEIPGYEEKIEKNGIIALEIEALQIASLGRQNQEIYVGIEAPKGDDWTQDEDTLDTWFSSGLWTFSTLGWPASAKALTGEDGDLKQFHPTSWMQMGYEILFFWMARMILMSTYALDVIPFREVYIHGILRDKEGRKFSKSLGNGINPIEIINNYGADALRLSLVLGITPGNDSKFYEEKVEGARNFVNKLWNISRFVITNYKKSDDNSISSLSEADVWIIAKKEKLIQEVNDDLFNYRFSQAGEKLKEFTWSDLADWYLEVSKFEKDENKSTILYSILRDLLKMWHPFIPFVTEVIWGQMYDNLLMIERWPQDNRYSGLIKERDYKNFELIKNIITAIRNARSENKVEPSKKIKAVIATKNKKELIDNHAELIKRMRTGIEGLEIKTESEKLTDAIHIVVSDVEIYLFGAVDKTKERERIQKEINNLEKLIINLEEKLKNKEFVSRAPKAIVNKEKEKLSEYKLELEKLKNNKF